MPINKDRWPDQTGLSPTGCRPFFFSLSSYTSALQFICQSLCPQLRWICTKEMDLISVNINTKVAQTCVCPKPEGQILYLGDSIKINGMLSECGRRASWLCWVVAWTWYAPVFQPFTIDPFLGFSQPSPVGYLAAAHPNTPCDDAQTHRKNTYFSVMPTPAWYLHV